MDGLKSIGIETTPDLIPKIYDYVPEAIIKLHSVLQRNKPDLIELINNEDSSRLARGIESIVRDQIKDEFRDNGEEKRVHFEKISEYFFPGRYSDPGHVSTTLYTGDLMQAYRDIRYYLTASSAQRLNLAIGEVTSVILLACAGLSADVAYNSYLLGNPGDALINAGAAAAFTLLSTFGSYLYFVSPLAKLAEKRARSATDFFPGTKIPRAAALLAAIWAHDSMEDGYWDKINAFIEEGDFGEAGVFVKKIVNLVTRKNNYLERISEYAAEVNSYLESSNISLNHLIGKDKKTDREVRLLDKLRIIIGYKNATIYEQSNEWRPEVDLYQIDLKQYTDVLEELMKDVKLENNIGKYFKITGVRESYALFIRGIYTETDEYLREAAILVKKGDTCHNLETIPKDRITHLWEKYLVKGALFEIGVSPLYCTVGGQRKLHEIAGAEFASLRAIEPIKAISHK